MEPDRSKPVRFSRHAEERLSQRGTSRDEVEAAVRHGQASPVREGRWMLRMNIESEAIWQGLPYRVKQVAPIVVEESDELVVVTVLTFFF